MPAIADQVATIEHDLSIAQTLVDSLRSENSQLKNALAALNVDHSALQMQHADALAMVDETRQHADGVASAALAMLKVSRRSVGSVAPSEGTKALQTQDLYAPIAAAALASVAAAVEPEKTDVRPELPTVEEQGQQDTAEDPLQSDSGDEQPFTVGNIDRAPNLAWQNADHPVDLDLNQLTNAERFRAHMPGEDPMPIFLTPRPLPESVLG